MMETNKLEELIRHEQYLYPKGTTLTLCVITLWGGFTITGKSACIKPEDFNVDLGVSLARTDALRQLEAFEAYCALRRAGPPHDK